MAKVFEAILSYKKMIFEWPQKYQASLRMKSSPDGCAIQSNEKYTRIVA
jgi:hypothetical protein